MREPFYMDLYSMLIVQMFVFIRKLRHKEISKFDIKYFILQLTVY
jgi:hypothetical protein